jgi:hypothetical protein
MQDSGRVVKIGVQRPPKSRLAVRRVIVDEDLLRKS